MAATTPVTTFLFLSKNISVFVYISPMSRSLLSAGGVVFVDMVQRSGLFRRGRKSRGSVLTNDKPAPIFERPCVQGFPPDFPRMHIHLQRLSVLQFRNHREAALELGPQVNCITGPNGTGKTNLL